jgi:hypothetical protein
MDCFKSTQSPRDRGDGKARFQGDMTNAERHGVGVGLRAVAPLTELLKCNRCMNSRSPIRTTLAETHRARMV